MLAEFYFFGPTNNFNQNFVDWKDENYQKKKEEKIDFKTDMRSPWVYLSMLESMFLFLALKLLSPVVGWVVWIKIKANSVQFLLKLPIWTELGKKSNTFWPEPL